MFNSLPITPILSTFSNPFASRFAMPLFGSSMPYMTTTFMPIFNYFSKGTTIPSGTSSSFSWFPSFNISSFMPKFSFSLPSFSSLTSSVRQTASSAGSGGQKVEVSSANQNASFWQSLGYNADKGVKLAKDAASHVVGFTKQCARYVKSAIQRCGLGEYKPGNGCDMARVLAGNKNFKQISPDGVDLKKLPAGCVLVFGAGVSGYNARYGHTEITTGTGKAVSDGITNNLRKPSAIFIPV